MRQHRDEAQGANGSAAVADGAVINGGMFLPYRYAHWYVLGIIPLSIIAFWDSFFSRMPEARAAVHLHSWSATLWVILLAAQNWVIHHRRFALHASIGRLSLAVFPVFLGSFLLVIQSEAKSVLRGDPFRTVFGPGIAVLTLIAAVTIGYLYYAGLKHRNSAPLHARYMITIPFLFTESILGRIFNAYLPGLIVTSLEDLRRIYWAIHLSQLLAIACAVLLYLQHRTVGRPFLIVAVALVLQSIGLEVYDDVAWWRAVYLASAGVPFSVTLATGTVIGILVVSRGWSAGTRDRRVRTSSA